MDSNLSKSREDGSISNLSKPRIAATSSSEPCTRRVSFARIFSLGSGKMIASSPLAIRRTVKPKASPKFASFSPFLTNVESGGMHTSNNRIFRSAISFGSAGFSWYRSILSISSIRSLGPWTSSRSLGSSSTDCT